MKGKIKGGSNPIRGKPLFHLTRNFTLIAQLVGSRNGFERVYLKITVSYTIEQKFSRTIYGSNPSYFIIDI